MTATSGFAARNYSVEVTAWGPGAEFFSERTTLQEAQNRRSITIHHPLMAGAIVFIRPASGQDRNLYPLIFHAESVSFPDQRGRREVSLVQVH